MYHAPKTEYPQIFLLCHKTGESRYLLLFTESSGLSTPKEYTLDGEHFQIFRSISRDLHWGHFYFFSFENRPILVFGSILVVGSALRNSHPLKYETLCSQKGSVLMLNVGKINNTAFFYISCQNHPNFGSPTCQQQ